MKDNGEDKLFMKWRLTLSEVVSFVAVVITMTLWIINTFQSKSDALETKHDFAEKFSELSRKQEVQSASMTIIGADVSYIRGHIDGDKNKK